MRLVSLSLRLRKGFRAWSRSQVTLSDRTNFCRATIPGRHLHIGGEESPRFDDLDSLDALNMIFAFNCRRFSS